MSITVNMQKREAYIKAKAAFEEIERQIGEIEKPFYDQMKAATAHLKPARDDAEEALDAAMDDCPEYIGKCECCEVHLFEGDKGFKYSDDEIYYCEEHAPTWADVLEQYEREGAHWSDFDLDSEEEFRETVAAIRAHNPEEKNVWVL